MNEREIDLVEFERLRQEIDGRTNLAYGLIALEIAALGAAISVVDKVPDVLLGAAIISSYLWLFWMDHAGQIYKIAAYIAIKLAPRLRTISPGSMAWEFFLRELDAGNERSRLALFSASQLPSNPRGLWRPGSADWYTALLFGGAPPILLFTYAFILPNAFVPLRIFAMTVGTLLWLLTCLRFRIFTFNIRIVGSAISAQVP